MFVHHPFSCFPVSQSPLSLLPFPSTYTPHFAIIIQSQLLSALLCELTCNHWALTHYLWWWKWGSLRTAVVEMSGLWPLPTKCIRNVSFLVLLLFFIFSRGSLCQEAPHFCFTSQCISTWLTARFLLLAANALYQLTSRFLLIASSLRCCTCYQHKPATFRCHTCCCFPLFSPTY